MALLAICLGIVGLPDTARPQALAARGTIDLSDHNLITDSYDSSDPSKSTNGQYDPARYKGDKGDVMVGPMGAPGGIINSLSASGGSAKIYGHAHTGPGSQAAVLQIGPQGYCGAHADELAVGTGNVDPGWWVPDSNFEFRTNSFPNTTGYQSTIPSGYLMITSNWSVSYTTNVSTYPDPAPPGGVTVVCGALTFSTNPPLVSCCLVVTNNNNGVKSYFYRAITGYSYTFTQSYTSYYTNQYDSILYGNGASSLACVNPSNPNSTSNPYVLTSGVTGQTNYFVTSSLFGDTIVIGSNVVLAISGGLNMSGNDGFTVGRNANVIVYSGGTSCVVGGIGVINLAGYAADFVLYAAPTVTSLSFNSNGGFIGVLVAPSANIALNDGGNGGSFTGCLVANAVTMTGNYNFHFDESLRTAQLCPPELTAQPQSRNVTAGQNVAFSVSASAAASYQWQFNGTNLLNATNATLTLSNVQPGDAGGYSVVVENALGSFTSIAAMLTLPPPNITSQPTSQAAVVGGSVTFLVAAAGQPPLSYQWRASGADLSGQTNASLTIAPVRSSDFTDYTVLVSDADGSVLSAVAALTPAASPAISSFGLNLDTATLGFPTEQGPTYVVEYKLSLGEAVWRELTRVAGTGLPITVTDIGLTDAARFYRVQVR
ncbi:MAG TPA: immunoglobulin domain-containing protein [Candidatus Acidoferrum sp.]|nr:immunoglobulin domain-containing protein [Candidatus Acidoferrum sp.]